MEESLGVIARVVKVGRGDMTTAPHEIRRIPGIKEEGSIEWVYGGGMAAIGGSEVSALSELLDVVRGRPLHGSGSNEDLLKRLRGSRRPRLHLVRMTGHPKRNVVLNYEGTSPGGTSSLRAGLGQKSQAGGIGHGV